ncbi:MAG: DUF445 family protein [Ruminococcaceae bacterium]|jgi:uncharacterized membrane protein YheB (UPF0754 family)|nr:DUF445 family protein [Oscillospiraceae bacterium]
MSIPAILKILVPIVLGAAIGYFTNDLAIRMLFRPRKAVFIGKWQLPFTPGIIPKNQSRIAGAVANAVSGQLFTSDDLVNQLKGSAVKGEIAGKLADAVFSPDLSIRSLTALAAPASEEEEAEEAEDAGGADPSLPDPSVVTDALVDTETDPCGAASLEDWEEQEPKSAAERAGRFVADRVAEKLAETDLRDAIDDLVWEGVQEYRKNPVIALFLNESAVNSICEKVESALRSYVSGDGRRVIASLVTEEADRLADLPLSELADKAGLDRDRVAGALGRTFDRFIEQFGASFSEKTDIGGIVRRKIEEMDAAQLEELVMSVMKRELQAVINLGALLGAVIGAVNILF